MTTRITLAILLTTWVVLIIGETAAFIIARQSLTAVLDDTIITRASHTLEQQVTEIKTGDMSNPPGDRFVIRDEKSGKELAHSEPRTRPLLKPYLVERRFTVSPEGENIRELTLRTFILQNGEKVPITITYSRPATRFDALLSQLAIMLL